MTLEERIDQLEKRVAELEEQAPEQPMNDNRRLGEITTKKSLSVVGEVV